MTLENTIKDLEVVCPLYKQTCEEARAGLRRLKQKCAFAVDMTKETESKIIGGGVKKEQMEVCAIPSLPAMMTQLHEGQKKLSQNQAVIVSALGVKPQNAKGQVSGSGPPR